MLHFLALPIVGVTLPGRLWLNPLKPPSTKALQLVFSSDTQSKLGATYVYSVCSIFLTSLVKPTSMLTCMNYSLHVFHQSTSRPGQWSGG